MLRLLVVGCMAAVGSCLVLAPSFAAPPRALPRAPPSRHATVSMGLMDWLGKLLYDTEASKRCVAQPLP